MADALVVPVGIFAFRRRPSFVLLQSAFGEDDFGLGEFLESSSSVVACSISAIVGEVGRRPSAVVAVLVGLFLQSSGSDMPAADIIEPQAFEGQLPAALPLQGLWHKGLEMGYRVPWRWCRLG